VTLLEFVGGPHDGERIQAVLDIPEVVTFDRSGACYRFRPGQSIATDVLFFDLCPTPGGLM
jgi:hypothetical protein